MEKCSNSPVTRKLGSLSYRQRRPEGRPSGWCRHSRPRRGHSTIWKCIWRRCLDTEELGPDELEQEYALELQATLLATVEKRDRVGQFLAHLESQIAFAHAEVARLQA